MQGSPKTFFELARKCETLGATVGGNHLILLGTQAWDGKWKSFVPKLHITLPSVAEERFFGEYSEWNRQYHYSISYEVFERLFAMRRQVGEGEMAFKLMLGYPYRIGGAQFGKDFTVCLKSADAYRKASSEMNGLAGWLSAFGVSWSGLLELARREGTLGEEDTPNLLGEVEVFPPFIHGRISNFGKGSAAERSQELLRSPDAKRSNNALWNAYFGKEPHPL